MQLSVIVQQTVGTISEADSPHMRKNKTGNSPLNYFILLSWTLGYRLKAWLPCISALPPIFNILFYSVV